MIESSLGGVVLCGQGGVDEVVDGVLVGAVGCSQRGRDRRVGVGELGESGAPQPGVQSGEESGLGESGGGDAVAEGAVAALDEAVGGEPS